MKEIGVGIIGASPTTPSWAVTAHIPALRALPGYRLRAVATSRRASADAAAAAWGVDAFDDARALIDHPDVDLVVVAVKVPQHHDLAAQALAAGKMVYSEWPLGVNLEEATHLNELAAAAGVRTAVGLQARFAPAVRRLRELVTEGYAGRVLATTLTASAMGWDAVTSRKYAFLFDVTNGVTTLSVSTAHALDALTYVLGDIDRVTATLAVARPEVLIAEENTTVPVTAPDQVAVTAALRSGAVASVFYRGGRSRAGGLRWEINGTSGDLLLTSASADGNIQSTELTLAGGNGTATEVSPLTVPTYLDADLAAVPAGPPRNVAAVYAAFAKDLAKGTHEVPDFTHALRIHQLLADIETAARH
ncbi:Gfo/Idh/MocA family oxidoreductase [Streptomyces sp. NPDC007206]|uniref:Gfo/Idh/MocA family protein n=1 Tax=Streptomyces sp. NPDC007206 TaxID=3154317 RepID=UPI0033DD672E